MAIRWYGLVAPEEAPTGDRRMFASQSLTYRNFPLPAAWQRVSGTGHQGAVVVGSWGRQYAGEGGVWGAGEFLDPAIVPEVIEAIYLLERRLIGPSVDLDPDMSYEVVPHPDRDDEYAMRVTRGNVHGVTFVMSPAFPQVHITVDNDEEMAILASAGITSAVFAVNSKSWNRFPLAPRETKFDADTAIQNIAAWSGGDAAKFATAFLWRDDDGNPLNRETYRLPIIDIFDGKPYLIPRAVFSAGVIMSGGHGGLYDTLPEKDRTKVQEVITDIYDMLRQEYADPRLIAPWQRGGRQDATSSASLISWNRYSTDEAAPSVVIESASTRSTAPTANACSAHDAVTPEGTAKATLTVSTVAGSSMGSGLAIPTTEKRFERLDVPLTSSVPSTSKSSVGARDLRVSTELPLSNTTPSFSSKAEDAPFAEEEMSKILPLTMSTEPAVCEVCSVQIATEGSDFSQTGPIDSEPQPSTLTTTETFAVRSSGWSSMPTSTAAWDEGAARRALDTWAGDDMGKYGRAFLYTDGSNEKTGFKFPIAKPVNGTLTIFIHAVNNAKARLSSANIPSADKTRIGGILDSIQKRYAGSDSEASLMAAGVLKPSRHMFANPKFTRVTPLTVDGDGRVYGHLATWRQCHMGVGNKCVMPPRSATGYQHFKQGSVLTAEGDIIRIGKITMGTGHADKAYGVIPAVEHYDDTGTCAAVVNAGEDDFGVWVAGALVADTDEVKAAELRRSPLSGDWRRVNGNLELVAALAVNSPGFPILHEQEGSAYSLVAAGALTEPDGGVTEPPLAGEAFDPSVFAQVDAYLAEVGRAERADRINAMFHDLLPEEGCGCDVRL